MEFELGLKLTKCLDEFESADLVISKDGAGPLFISRETETMFILTAHLRGYIHFFVDYIVCAYFIFFIEV